MDLWRHFGIATINITTLQFIRNLEEKKISECSNVYEVNKSVNKSIGTVTKVFEIGGSYTLYHDHLKIYSTHDMLDQLRPITPCMNK